MFHYIDTYICVNKKCMFINHKVLNLFCQTKQLFPVVKMTNFINSARGKYHRQNQCSNLAPGLSFQVLQHTTVNAVESLLQLEPTESSVGKIFQTLCQCCTCRERGINIVEVVCNIVVSTVLEFCDYYSKTNLSPIISDLLGTIGRSAVSLMASNMAVKGLPNTRGSLPLGVLIAVTIVPVPVTANSCASVGKVSSAFDARNKLAVRE